jgi:hypothetical protein
MDRMHAFLDLVLALRYQVLYVLVDQLDEAPLFADRVEIVRFLQPLLTDLKLLEAEHLAFKIFLPRYLTPEILRMVEFRTKRLTIRDLAWGEDDLLALLTRRLQGFSEGRVRSLQRFCEPALAQQMVLHRRGQPPVPYVDLALVRAAHGLPRDLILRGRRLFEIYAARHSAGLIEEADLEQAIHADLGTDDPPAYAPATPAPAAAAPHQASGEVTPPRGLYIDQVGQVWRDGALLPQDLPPTVFKLLQYLCIHRYEFCTFEAILADVWGPGYGIESVRAALRRLRVAVERDPDYPRFLITSPRRGIRLVDGLG